MKSNLIPARDCDTVATTNCISMYSDTEKDPKTVGDWNRKLVKDRDGLEETMRKRPFLKKF